MSIRHQADLLSLNRSGLYYVPRGVSPEEVAMKHRIDELYTKWPFYGSRRITACLRREDVSSSRKRVQRYMQEMGIEGIHPGLNFTIGSCSKGNVPGEWPRTGFGIAPEYPCVKPFRGLFRNLNGSVVFWTLGSSVSNFGDQSRHPDRQAHSVGSRHGQKAPRSYRNSPLSGLGNRLYVSPKNQNSSKKNVSRQSNPLTNATQDLQGNLLLPQSEPQRETSTLLQKTCPMQTTTL